MSTPLSVTIDSSYRDLRLDLSHDRCEFQVRRWTRSALSLDSNATHFGFVVAGTARIVSNVGEYLASTGMYWSLPGGGSVQPLQPMNASEYDDAVEPMGIVVSQFGYKGLFQLGGPIESTGRLRYIDGCSDTLLLSPVLKGDACLNLLCLPENTDQTAHTHPSFRVGTVVNGLGLCRYGEGQVAAMEPGSLFVLPANCVHSFHTRDEPLTVVAFHPDSDFGPWHDDHPMINRTILDLPTDSAGTISTHQGCSKDRSK